MPLFYGDSSALAKIYVAEVGSAWMRRVAHPSPVSLLFTVHLTLVELTSAISRRGRAGSLTARQATAALNQLRVDWTWRYIPIALHSGHVQAAAELAERHGLRGYDAVHLAVALDLHGLRQARGLPGVTFISADLEQLRAARAEGLAVDDPNANR